MKDRLKILVQKSFLLSKMWFMYKGIVESFRFLLEKKKFEKGVFKSRVEKFRNIAPEGSRCFVIGNGPSLCAKDLELLKDEICFACNAIYEIYPETEWRPAIYTVQDEKLLKREREIDKKAESGITFLSFNALIRNHNQIPKDSVPLLVDNRKGARRCLNIDFAEDISKSVYDCGTVTYTNLQIALYMGFREIYLLGVDHRFAARFDSRLRVVTYDKEIKNHFNSNYDTNIDGIQALDKERWDMGYCKAKEIAEKRGVAIFNATRGGDLEIFPRVDFDLLMD